MALKSFCQVNESRCTGESPPPLACHGHVALCGSVGRHKNVIKRQHVVTVCLHDMFVINYMPLKSFSTKCVFVKERRIQHWFKLIACYSKLKIWLGNFSSASCKHLHQHNIARFQKNTKSPVDLWLIKSENHDIGIETKYQQIHTKALGIKY